MHSSQKLKNPRQWNRIFVRLLVNSSLSILSIIILLSIGELFFRVLYKDDFDRWLAGPSHSVEKENALYYDYEGDKFFRQLQFIYDPSKVNILGCGDSFTFGTGVRDFNELYLSKLNTRLQEIYPTNINNAAKGGYNAMSVLEVLVKFTNTCKQDIALYGLNLNDILTKKKQIEIEDRQLRSPITDSLIKRSYLLFDLSFRLERFLEMLRGTSYSDNISKLYHERGIEWKLFSADITALKNYCESNEIELLVAILPFLVNLKNYPLKDVHRQIKELCLKNDIDCIDLLPQFEGFDAKKLWAHPYDAHPNSHSHTIIADGIFSRLSEKVKEKANNMKRMPDEKVIVVSMQSPPERKDPVLAELLNLKISIDHDNPYLHRDLGFIYYNLGKIDSAVIQFQTALRMKPDFINAMNSLGTIFGRTKDYDSAIELYNKVLQIDPPNVKALNSLAYVYSLSRNYNKCIEVLKTAVEFHSKNKDFYNSLISALIVTREYNVAQEYLQQAEKVGIIIDPDIVKKLKSRSSDLSR